MSGETELRELDLDLRGLECPDPLVRILALIDCGEPLDKVTVRLDQEPLFLYPELDARGWRYERLAAAGGCRLRLTRPGT